jgi:hypothetical protein
LYRLEANRPQSTGKPPPEKRVKEIIRHQYTSQCTQHVLNLAEGYIYSRLRPFLDQVWLLKPPSSSKRLTLGTNEEHEDDANDFALIRLHFRCLTSGVFFRRDGTSRTTFDITSCRLFRPFHWRSSKDSKTYKSPRIFRTCSQLRKGCRSPDAAQQYQKHIIANPEVWPNFHSKTLPTMQGTSPLPFSSGQLGTCPSLRGASSGQPRPNIRTRGGGSARKLVSPAVRMEPPSDTATGFGGWKHFSRMS